jgi:hypothetical protein
VKATAEVTTPRAESVAKVRKNITVTNELFDDFMELKKSGETQGALLQRMIESMHAFDVLKSDHATRGTEIERLHEHIAERDEELEDLRSRAGTAIMPGGKTFTIKDAMDSLKDVCDDDAVCIKFAAKMVEAQAAAVNRHLDREHNAEQKRLDREEKEKDRALKKKLAESRAMHDKDMTMIKKGMVRKEDLENIVFLGQKSSTPQDRIRNTEDLAAR